MLFLCQKNLVYVFFNEKIVSFFSLCCLFLPLSLCKWVLSLTSQIWMNFLKVTLTASFTYLGYYNTTTVLCHVSLCYVQKYKHQTKTTSYIYRSSWLFLKIDCCSKRMEWIISIEKSIERTIGKSWPLFF